ncbi:hypothetical protein SELMODRAFT_424205 [Selaginella moellendorffii]|uniref:Uncharacterized protein n=1 Tax=Selaginella moellendorffii TaxID=88036 RepID=D8SP55_SELML|nr:hypothetical protein SELMODRAFT_424205 [Selaginella moellendorffii]
MLFEKNRERDLERDGWREGWSGARVVLLSSGMFYAGWRKREHGEAVESELLGRCGRLGEAEALLRSWVEDGESGANAAAIGGDRGPWIAFPGPVGEEVLEQLSGEGFLWSLRLCPILRSQQSLLGSNSEENQNNSDLFASMISLLLPNAERDPKAEQFATAAMRCLLITGALSLVAAGDEGCIKEWRMDPSWRHSLYETDLPPARYNPKTFRSILKL